MNYQAISITSIFYNIMQSFKNNSPKIIVSLIIFVAGWYLIKLTINITIKALKKAKVNESIISFTYSIMKTTLRIILFIIVLITLNIIKETSLITALSALTVTIGLAAKDSLSNIASGILIITNKTFSVGDHIQITDKEKGIVIKIEMMFTTLTTEDNKSVIIPNSRLTSESIINYTPIQEGNYEI